MKRLTIKCIKCKKVKDCAHYDSRILKDGRTKYETTCVVCKRERRQLIKDVRLAASYGMSYAELDKLRNESNQACAICHKPDGKLVIDHCHTTGIVRGILCHTCNTRLGVLEYLIDKNTLISSLEYLETKTNRILESLNS